jgi:hypothetical protein
MFVNENTARGWKGFVSGAVGLAVALLVGVAVHGTAMAETPDGTTPANEGVCNSLKAPGITPALYGLCVAYCEAQDLDTFDKEPPSTKILENYNKKKVATDPAMPCIQIPCPCWSDAELASFAADNAAAACLRSTGKIQIINNSPLTNFAEANTNAGLERCRYIDRNVSPIQVRSQTITPAQAQSCYVAVSATCDALGL